MNELMTYGLSSMLICFTVLTFALNRFQTDVFPEEYEFALDPFWYIISVLFLGGTVTYFVFPALPDMVVELKYVQILLPFIFAVLIYFCFLFEFDVLGNLMMLGAAGVITYMLPDGFALFPKHLTLWQDRLATVGLMFTFAKGLGLLNGIGAVAGMQFAAIMLAAVLLAHFGALPYVLGAIAFAYLGTMIAFLFFSWPPEKIYLTHHAVDAIGFVMASFMLSAAEEFAEAPIAIAGSLIISEVLFALYDRYFNYHKTDALFMNTSYYKTSQGGEYDLGVSRGVMKILVIDVVLCLAQILATDQHALLIFAVLFNLWLLSILSGSSKPQPMFSVTKLGFKAVSGIFKKSSKSDKKNQE